MNVSIAIWEDGALRMVTDGEAPEAIRDGGIVYSPLDTWMYIHLDDHSRRLLHQFKKRFTGKVEWSMKCERCGRPTSDIGGEIPLCDSCLALIIREWKIRHDEYGELTQS